MSKDPAIKNLEMKERADALKITPWGEILWRTCQYVNSKLADRWENYSIASSVSNDEKLLNNLVEEKELIAKKTLSLKEEISGLSKAVTASYRQYINSGPDKNLIRLCREYKQSYASGEQLNDLQKSYVDNYKKSIGERSANELNYQNAKKNLTEATESYNGHIKANTANLRSITSKINMLTRRIKKNHLVTPPDIDGDRNRLLTILNSDKLTNRLFLASYAILSKHSVGIFNNVFSMSEKENVMEGYFNELIKCTLNYDFIVGCYHPVDGKLIMMDEEMILDKIYLGYYSTLKGCMIKSFQNVYNEHFNKDSLNGIVANHNDDDASKEDWLCNPANRSNASFENCFAGTMSPRMISNRYVVDEHTCAFWKNLQNYLFDNIGIMTKRMASAYIEQYPDGYFTNAENTTNVMSDALMTIIKRIDAELTSKQTIGTKLNHIIMDAFKNMVCGTEKKYLIENTKNILKSFICKFFVENLQGIIGNDVELMFRSDDVKNIYCYMQRYI